MSDPLDLELDAVVSHLLSLGTGNQWRSDKCFLTAELSPQEHNFCFESMAHEQRLPSNSKLRTRLSSDLPVPHLPMR